MGKIKLCAKLLQTEGLKLLEESKAEQGKSLMEFGENLSKLVEEGDGKLSGAELKALYEEQSHKNAIEAVAKTAGKYSKQFHSILPLLSRAGHEDFTFMDFEPSLANTAELVGKKVLCVGAGGLGCEILKNLALSGVKDITVIDLDTIDVSNLNRQFLFRRKDVGKPKAQVAAEFIEQRCKGVRVKWYKQKIQEFGDEFYKQFSIVIAGLDNVNARLFLNTKLYSLVKTDEDGDPQLDTIIPLVDGGTEGFKGQARFFLYPFTSCFECSAGDLQGGPKFDLCTIRTMPRIPEHCVAYALLIQWPLLEEFKDHKTYKLRKDTEKASGEKKAVNLDKDNTEHMTWLYERSKERAAKYKIEGVTYNLTMQYVKNIIPAIASTNALISAACSNEAIKYLTKVAPTLENYFFYSGQNGCYTRTFEYKKNPECFTCGVSKIHLEVHSTALLGDIKKQLDQKHKLECSAFVTRDGKAIYNAGAFFVATHGNLERTIEVLLPKKTNILTLFAKKPGSTKLKKISLTIVKADTKR
uniref:NEDD8-activating enzyme E1 catalytic subunit n=1 Tax=Amorphochlora amoebiformis TaxID=1561963 RepID=A0A7S0GL90_9EUKA